VPPQVMNALEKHFGVTYECFASPLNSYFSKFYSIFKVDEQFGSYGNFYILDSES